MDIQKRYRIELGDTREFTLMLIGCGGTGSFAALHLARLAWSARQNGGPGVKLVFVDPDTVELKNVGRQNFCPAEIGQPKAATLARRFGLAFGLEIWPVVDKFSFELLDNQRTRQNIIMLIGAVDSPAARRDIDAAMRREIRGPMPTSWLWWLDAGNGEHSGQVLLGNVLGAEPMLSPLGVCVGLPLPSVQEPGIVAKDEGREARRKDEGLSCAELMAMEAQSLMINQAMAGWLGEYVSRLMLKRDLDLMATYLDLRTGTATSKAITGGQIIGKPEQVEARDNDEDEADICPECGGRLIYGENEIDGEMTEIVFCDTCHWQITREEFEQRQPVMV